MTNGIETASTVADILARTQLLTVDDVDFPVQVMETTSTAPATQGGGWSAEKVDLLTTTAPPVAAALGVLQRFNNQRSSNDDVVVGLAKDVNVQCLGRYRGPLVGVRGRSSRIANVAAHSAAHCGSLCDSTRDTCLAFSFRLDRGRCWLLNSNSLELWIHVEYEVRVVFAVDAVIPIEVWSCALRRSASFVGGFFIYIVARPLDDVSPIC